MMVVLTLCREDNLCKELWGYARAFRRYGITLSCVSANTPPDAHIDDLLSACPSRPDFILSPDTDFCCMPYGLTEVDIPTVCFQFDTYNNTSRRIRWSTLFDIPVLFHPGFEQMYRDAGHARPLTLAHAAQHDFYDNELDEKTIDLGWVGRTRGAPYATRKRILPRLAREFRMNDWAAHYTLEETAEIYRKSKIVLNISRDDYPQDANMRVFEAMAAGALLITGVPTNLSTVGFKEGEHFVGYEREEDIAKRIHRHLNDEQLRRRIARAGRQLVLERHTYDARVGLLVRFIAECGNKFSAPARRKRVEEVRLMHLDYYTSMFNMKPAFRELNWLASHDVRCAAKGAYLIGRAQVRQSVNRVQEWLR
jgi:hypothetical protein